MGIPNREVMTDNFDAIAIGSVAGLIHGSTAVLQDEIGSFGDFSDSLCAPVHEETQYKTDTPMKWQRVWRPLSL